MDYEGNALELYQFASHHSFSGCLVAGQRLPLQVYGVFYHCEKLTSISLSGCASLESIVTAHFMAAQG